MDIGEDLQTGGASNSPLRAMATAFLVEWIVLEPGLHTSVEADRLHLAPSRAWPPSADSPRHPQTTDSLGRQRLLQPAVCPKTQIIIDSSSDVNIRLGGRFFLI
jgi:hypothetical protein